MTLARRWIGLVCISATLTGLAGAVWAAPGERATRSALIIAIANYGPANIHALDGVPFDVNSARMIAKTMGIPDQRINVLRDGQATKAGILQALDALGQGVTEGGRVLLYFSGHGTRWLESNGRCKEGLLAYDGQALTNDEIALRTRRMSEVADKVIVMFDACHSEGVSARRPAATRSMAEGKFTAKFFLKNGFSESACAANNLQTRSLLDATTRLGAMSENFVQITSSRANEVSYDEPGKGGMATQGVRDCLLGRARDRDASGAVSMAEIEQCAQASIDEKLKSTPHLRHHISVTGNRNLVPVAVVRPPPPPAPIITAAAPVAPAPTLSSIIDPPTPAPVVEPALASLSTLKEIEAQRNPKRRVDVTADKTTLRIGKDPLNLQIKSARDGFVYLVLLGSDRKSFYVLFPKGLDRDNAIRANTPLKLPRPDWQVVAQGPAGTDHLLVIVSDTPRDLNALTLSPPDAKAPFTFALNDLPGRAALFDFFTGRGVTGTSEAFGAKLIALQEVR